MMGYNLNIAFAFGTSIDLASPGTFRLAALLSRPTLQKRGVVTVEAVGRGAFGNRGGRQGSRSRGARVRVRVRFFPAAPKCPIGPLPCRLRAPILFLVLFVGAWRGHAHKLRF